MTLALVVLVDGQASGAFHLDGATCLNQLARCARFLPPRVELHLFDGASEEKWVGRGEGSSPMFLRDVAAKLLETASQNAKGAARKPRKLRKGS